MDSNGKQELEQVGHLSYDEEGGKDIETADNITPEMEYEITMQAKLIAIETQLKNLRKRNVSPSKCIQLSQSMLNQLVTPLQNATSFMFSNILFFTFLIHSRKEKQT